MGKVSINETTLTNIGAAIREKTGKTDLIAPGEMPAEIKGIVSGGNEPTDEELIITGRCMYRFGYGGWDWVLERYGNRMTTKDITDGTFMFLDCTASSIPFDLNFKSGSSVNIQNFFSGCESLTELPRIYNIRPSAMNDMFSNCSSLRSIPDDYFDDFDWSYMETLTNAYQGSVEGMFYNCYGLRKLPSLSFVLHTNPVVNYSYAFVYNAFDGCHALDEVLDIPIAHMTATYTSNAFSTTVRYCFRLKNFTLGASGPKNWKSQTIDFTYNTGYYSNTVQRDSMLKNSGITKDKEVTDDTTYQALKNDPDWFTGKIEYSRYNHDSAVATINSLPDTSAYLTSAGGTNTLKFKGAAGSATDGGAINTLTEEEIAVAASRGWTVTLT